MPYTRVVPAPGVLLLRWFDTYQRRLPWRTPFPRDPYLVLLSEVMLQQTQIRRVLQLYLRFLKRFPSVAALARAEEEEVLTAWSGLGYYRRARALHAAARVIETAGTWPTTRQELLALPGLGPYTAAAVAAFAFSGDDPPVDGNILRVAARVLGLDAPVGSAQLFRAAESWAREMYRTAPTPQTYEALMELGGSICRPKAPACRRCPLASVCAAGGAGTAERYPTPRSRRPCETHRWVALWLVRPDGRVLLCRRPSEQLLGGLWLPPVCELADGQDPLAAAQALLCRLGADAPLHPAPALAHSITFRRITVRPFVGRHDVPLVSEDTGVRWAKLNEVEVATSSLTHKLRRVCEPRLSLGRSEGEES